MSDYLEKIIERERNTVTKKDFRINFPPIFLNATMNKGIFNTRETTPVGSAGKR